MKFYAELLKLRPSVESLRVSARYASESLRVALTAARPTGVRARHRRVTRLDALAL